MGLRSSSAFLALSSKVVMFGLLLIFFGKKGNMTLNNSKHFANYFCLFYIFDDHKWSQIGVKGHLVHLSANHSLHVLHNLNWIF